MLWVLNDIEPKPVHAKYGQRSPRLIPVSMTALLVYSQCARRSFAVVGGPLAQALSDRAQLLWREQP